MSTAPVSLPREHSVPREHIVVDLDGTLVLTDTFVASLLETCRKYPLRIPRLALSLFGGRASCKRAAAALARLDVACLPYNEPLLDYLRGERAAHRHLILATGADLSIASRVAAHLGIFDEVIASDGSRNVTGDEKLRAIRERIGDEPFTYAGNSRADLRVWRRAKSAILVGAPRSCARDLRAAGIAIERDFAPSRQRLRLLSRCLRTHQWSKNVLVFVPVFLGHRLGDSAVIGHAMIAFLALSFCASSLYIVNDLLDLQSDRLHPTKRRRPLAAGHISVEAGVGIGVVMAMAAGALSLLLPPEARILLACYATRLAALLSEAEAAFVCRRSHPRHALCAAGSVRRRGHRNRDFGLDAGVFFVSFHQPCRRQTRRRTAPREDVRRGGAERARLPGRRRESAGIARFRRRATWLFWYSLCISTALRLRCSTLIPKGSGCCARF